MKHVLFTTLLQEKVLKREMPGSFSEDARKRGRCGRDQPLWPPLSSTSFFLPVMRSRWTAGAHYEGDDYQVFPGRRKSCCSVIQFEPSSSHTDTSFSSPIYTPLQQLSMRPEQTKQTNDRIIKPELHDYSCYIHSDNKPDPLLR